MDLETPVSFYHRLKKNRHSFLLESVEGSERWARYSFLGTAPELVFKAWGREVEITQGRKRESRTCDDPLGGAGGDPRRIPAGREPAGSPLHRRRPGVRGLRRGGSAPRGSQHRGAGRPLSGHLFPAGAHPGELRQPQAHHHDHRQRAYRKRCAPAGPLRGRGLAHREPPVILAKDAQEPGGPEPHGFRIERQVPVQRHAAEVPRHGAPGQGVHRRGRRHPGGAVPAAGGPDAGRAVRDLPGPAVHQSVSLHVLPGAGRPQDHRLVAGDPGPPHRPGRRAPAHRRHPAPGPRRAGRTGAGRGSPGRPQGAGRAHHAGGSRAQRRGAGGQGGLGGGGRAHDRRALFPRHAHCLQHQGRAGPGKDSSRPVRLLLSRGDGLRRPQDTGHADHQRDGAGAPRAVRRRRGLPSASRRTWTPASPSAR